MNAAVIAFRLWIGSLLIIAGSLFVYGVVTLNGFFVFESVLVFIVGLFVSFPAFMLTVGLVRASCLLPYSVTARLWWLGIMLLLQNLAFLCFLGWMGPFLFEMKLLQAIFYISGFALVIMLLGSRNSIKKYYSQQTTSNQQL